MAKALIVSAGTNANEYLARHIAELGYTRPVIVPSGGEARRQMDGKDFEVECDSVISCAGYVPAPVDGGKNVQYIGDCSKVGNLRSVIWGAYEAAMKI